jgi:hypothetical protein
MRKIALTALGAALITLTVATAAAAAERHHARRITPHAEVSTNTDACYSCWAFGSTYPGYDARVWGGAMSAPAGR